MNRLLPLLALLCLCLLLPGACHRNDAERARQAAIHSDSIADALRQADHFIRIGMYDKAVECLRPAEQLARQQNDRGALVRICNKYFVLYNDDHQYPQALRYITEAADLARSMRDSTEYCKQINNKALLYIAAARYDSALLCFDEARIYARANTEALSDINTNIADVHFSQGDLPGAQSILEDIVATGPSNYHPYLNLALITSGQGDARSTRALIARTAGAADTLSPAALPDYYGQLTSIYLSLGDSVAAFRALLAYLDEAQRIDSAYNADRFHELSVEYHTEELASRNRILSLELTRRTISLVALAAVILLLASLVVVVRRRARAERLHNAAMAEKNAQILRMERELHEALREQVEKRDRELAAYAIERASDSQTRLTLARDAEKAAETSDTPDADLRLKLTELSRRLRQSDADAISRDFRVYFDRVHPRFVSTLHERHPNLTNNDLRLCVFLYLGMSTKEIAALLTREVRSVETARLRLRRKLDLGPGASLADYLHSLTKK